MGKTTITNMPKNTVAHFTQTMDLKEASKEITDYIIVLEPKEKQL